MCVSGAHYKFVSKLGSVERPCKQHCTHSLPCSPNLLLLRCPQKLVFKVTASAGNTITLSNPKAPAPVFNLLLEGTGRRMGKAVSPERPGLASSPSPAPHCGSKDTSSPAIPRNLTAAVSPTSDPGNLNRDGHRQGSRTWPRSSLSCDCTGLLCVGRGGSCLPTHPPGPGRDGRIQTLAPTGPAFA